MVNPWKKIESHPVDTYPVFKLRCDTYISPRNGRPLNAYVIESRDWALTMPVTKDGDIVMVRQYRFGREGISLEIPGGLIDRDDPSILEAARREMREETGYDSDDMVSLGKICPNPAVFNNTCHMFLARYAEYRCEQKLDEGEDIEVTLIPLSKIPDLIANGDIYHSIVLNAFYLYDLYLKRHG